MQRSVRGSCRDVDDLPDAVIDYFRKGQSLADARMHGGVLSFGAVAVSAEIGRIIASRLGRESAHAAISAALSRLTRLARPEGRSSPELGGGASPEPRSQIMSTRSRTQSQSLKAQPFERKPQINEATREWGRALFAQVTELIRHKTVLPSCCVSSIRRSIAVPCLALLPCLRVCANAKSH